MIGTYSELKEAVANWMNRSDLDTIIPDFIANGEARLNKRIRHRDMETTEALTLDATGSAPLPDGYLEWRFLVVDTTPQARPEFVEPDSREFLWRFRPYSVPQYFTVLGDTLRVQPASDKSASLTFYKKVPALSDTDTTNWLLDRSPEAYLYAALVEGATYLRDNEAIQTYSALFDNAAAELMQDGRASRVAREPGQPNSLATKTEEQMR